MTRISAEPRAPVPKGWPVLGLDPASECGWAIGKDRKILESGVWDLKPEERERAGVRYLRLIEGLTSWHEVHKFRLLAFEGVYRGFRQVGGAKASEYAFGYLTHIQSWAVRSRVALVSVQPSTLKSWATGKGKASKEEMVSMGRAYFKCKVTDHNEMDARWVCDWAMGGKR